MSGHPGERGVLAHQGKLSSKSAAQRMRGWLMRHGTKKARERADLIPVLSSPAKPSTKKPVKALSKLLELP